MDQVSDALLQNLSPFHYTFPPNSTSKEPLHLIQYIMQWLLMDNFHHRSTTIPPTMEHSGFLVAWIFETIKS
jgi:hypothetical protein